jgi:uncharacterized membrane protein
MTELARIAALIAIMGNVVVSGTDVFCAMVLRPADADNHYGVAFACRA